MSKFSVGDKAVLNIDYQVVFLNHYKITPARQYTVTALAGTLNRWISFVNDNNQTVTAHEQLFDKA